MNARVSCPVCWEGRHGHGLERTTRAYELLKRIVGQVLCNLPQQLCWQVQQLCSCCRHHAHVRLCVFVCCCLVCWVVFVHVVLSSNTKASTCLLWKVARLNLRAALFLFGGRNKPFSRPPSPLHHRHTHTHGPESKDEGETAI